MAAAGAAHEASEYGMVLTPSRTPPVAPDTGVAIRPVTEPEFPLFARLAGDPDHDDLERQRARFGRDIKRPDRQLYLAWLGETPIGTIRTVDDGARTSITTFTVLPAYRRQGHGRRVLTLLIDRLARDPAREIAIEVITDNLRALTLYESCGFRTTAAYAYYRHRIPPPPSVGIEQRGRSSTRRTGQPVAAPRAGILSVGAVYCRGPRNSVGFRLISCPSTFSHTW
jgi:ribosomal protein S18 acetylase RimI-like enzyme